MATKKTEASDTTKTSATQPNVASDAKLKALGLAQEQINKQFFMQHIERFEEILPLIIPYNQNIFMNFFTEIYSDFSSAFFRKATIRKTAARSFWGNVTQSNRERPEE